jgi:pimeloyl-ACP methyl ester carboxylesterase
MSTTEMIAPRTETAPSHEALAGISLLRWPGAAVATPIVLLHGIGSRAESWLPLARSLAIENTIIAWDAPGYGASMVLPKTTPRIDDYADALAALLRAAGLDEVILIGHSLGALIAARFAATRPRSVRALALLSPALGYGVAPGATLPPTIQARIDDLDRQGPTRFAAARAARLVHEPERNPELVARVRDAMASARQPGYGQAVHALASGDLLADAPKLAMPTLVAVGAEDLVTPPAGARRVHAALPDARGYAEIAHAGHALPQQAPDATARLLRPWLAEVADGQR